MLPGPKPSGRSDQPPNAAKGGGEGSTTRARMSRCRRIRCLRDLNRAFLLGHEARRRVAPAEPEEQPDDADEGDDRQEGDQDQGTSQDQTD